MIKKLKIKFTIIIMALFATLLAGILAFFYFQTKSNLYNDSLAAMKDYMSKPPYLVFGNPFERFFGEENNLNKNAADAFAVEYFSYSKVIVPYGFGDTITDEQKDYIFSIVKTTLDAKSNTGVIGGFGLRYLKQPFNGGVKIVFLDKTYEDSVLDSLGVTILIIGAGGFILFLLASLVITKIAVRPAERSWQQQKQLVADISHELKTPLTIISANADIIASRPNAASEETAKWLSYIKSETERMGSLISSLLYLEKSRKESGADEKTYLNLSELAVGACLPFESVCFEKGLTLSVSVKPDIFLTANAGLITRLIGILLDNAVKYSVPGGKVSFALQKTPDKIIMAVNNKGEVIPPERIRHLFERFYRGDESRSREEGGFGLGLAIAKEIAESHSGKIAVKSEKSEGTTFICSFKPS